MGKHSFLCAVEHKSTVRNNAEECRALPHNTSSRFDFKDIDSRHCSQLLHNCVESGSIGLISLVNALAARSHKTPLLLSAVLNADPLA